MNNRKLIEDEEEKTIRESYPYLHFWGRILQKLPFYPFESLFYYKNIPAFVWIVFFNPFMILPYILLGLIFLLHLCAP